MQSLLDKTCSWQRRIETTKGDYAELGYEFSNVESSVKCRVEILNGKDMEENGLRGEEGITYHWLFLYGDHDIKIGDRVVVSDESLVKTVEKAGNADASSNLHHMEVIIKRHEVL